MKYIVTLNGTRYEVEVEEGQAILVSQEAAIAAPQGNAPVPAPAVPPPAVTPPSPIAGSGQVVVAPMPGTVLKINTSIGQTVKKGDALLVLEAMKMEIDIQAPANGTVKELRTQVGSTVNTDDVLLVL